MKAILQNFGRRVNIDRREDNGKSFQSAIGSGLSVQHYQETYYTFDNAGNGIGDTPAKNLDRSYSSHSRATTSQENNTNAWSTKLSGSLRGNITRRKGAAPSDITNLETVSTADASTQRHVNRPLHPPSSYKKFSSNDVGDGGSSRGLVRKFSAISSQTNTHASSSPIAVHSSPSRLRPNNPGPEPSPSTQPVVSEFKATDASYSHGHFRPGLDPTSGKSLPLQPVSFGADVSAMSSAELAARLNELAVANADGLLTDDEYRTLRQAVFDQMIKTDENTMAASAASSPNGLGVPGHARAGDAAPAGSAMHSTAQTTAIPVANSRRYSRSSLGHGERHASSIRSGQSARSSSFILPGIFRKGVASPEEMQQQMSQDSYSSRGHSNRAAEHRAVPIRRDSEGTSSRLSSGDGHPHRALSLHTQHSSTAKSSRLSTFGRLRAGSQARRAQEEMAANDMEEAFAVERTARSLRAVSIYDASSAETSSINARTHDRTATSPRAELAPTTMFGAEYVDKSSAEIQAEIAVVQAEGNRMLSTFVTLEETLLSKQTSLDPQVVRGLLSKVQDATPLSLTTRLDGGEREASSLRVHRLRPPSSYRSPRQSTTLDASHKHEEGNVPQDVAALEAELTNIYAQKAAVVKRYQDRLAFLQSKLRSATIREGLK